MVYGRRAHKVDPLQVSAASAQVQDYPLPL